jgi:2-keto-4-pentenoate hydratase/2-oxohepta-3-ene-1,7-dioic acid hydratase in catechol pathway
MQDAPLSDLIWDIPDLIASYSKTIPFGPGDIFSAGTPGGVGAGRQPPVFMKAGDVISVSVEGVGEIRNPVTGP